MAQSFLLFLILAEAFVGVAMASEKGQTKVQDNAPSYSNPPASSPSNNSIIYQAEAPIIRKLGKHHHKMVKSLGALSLSPSETPQAREGTSSLDQSTSVENLSVQGQDKHLSKRHHSTDKSVAGGGVILGGLATTFLVAIFCYIKATGRHNAESTTTLIK